MPKQSVFGHSVPSGFVQLTYGKNRRNRAQIRLKGKVLGNVARMEIGSHFTIAYEMNAEQGTLGGWLTEEGRLEMTNRDGPAIRGRRKQKEATFYACPLHRPT
jgi:hypothetical protein